MFKILLLLYIIFLGGCGYTVPTFKQRVKTLQNLIKEKDLKQDVFNTKRFKIYSIHKDLSKCEGKVSDIYM